MHYRNVWLFLNSVDAIITIKKFFLIRINLHRCLKDDAQTWYIAELINEQRIDLTRDRDINRWKKKLIDRFKMNEADVLILLKENKYIVENVRRQRQTFFYVQSVVRHCKNVDFMIVSAQLKWTWNHFDSSFQRNINRLEFFITMLSFIQKMKKMQNVWKRYYFKEASKKSWQFSFSQQYDQNQNYNNNRGQQYDNNDNRNYDNNRDRNNQQYNHQNDQNRYEQSSYFTNSRSINQQQRFIEKSSSRQASWQKAFWNAFTLVTSSTSQTSTYYTNAIEKKYSEEKKKKS